VPDIFTFAHRAPIILAAARNNVPAVYWLPHFAREGGLLSYGPEPLDVFRRAASYVDRILRGEKPGDLPVQFPTKFEMVVNRKTVPLREVFPTRQCPRADCSSRRDGSRRRPVATNARPGRDQHRGGGPGTQLDVGRNFFEAHNHRYALRESDPLEGRTHGGQQLEARAAVLLGQPMLSTLPSKGVEG
jgi:hypothetical protein